MKKKYAISTLLLISLSGCGVIQQQQIEKKNNQIIANKSKIGKYPVYFANQIDEIYGKNTNISFAPVQYVTNENVAGWLTCIKQDKQITALIFNEDKIIFKESNRESPTIKSTCDYYYNKTDSDSYKTFLDEVGKETEKLKLSEVNNNVFGEPPVDPLNTIKKYMEKRLKDPSSGQYRDLELTKSYILNNSYRVSFGWKAKIYINGKNSYGGYTGFEPEYFEFKGNKLQ